MGGKPMQAALGSRLSAAAARTPSKTPRTPHHTELIMTATVTRGICMRTTGVHHVSLRCTDLERAKVFYIERLGFPLLLETGELFLFLAGGTAIGVRGPAPNTPPEDAFDPFRVGLDHVALGCTDALELH